MSILLVLLASGLAATVVLGPLGLGWLEWRVSPSGLLQLYGAHAAELVLVVPATLAAAWLWRRGHRLAPALALGAAVYALYVSLQFVLFPDYSLYPGNNERFFPLFLALAILAWTIAARSIPARAFKAYWCRSPRALLLPGLLPVLVGLLAAGCTSSTPPAPPGATPAPAGLDTLFGPETAAGDLRYLRRPSEKCTRHSRLARP